MGETEMGVRAEATGGLGTMGVGCILSNSLQESWGQKDTGGIWKTKVIISPCLREDPGEVGDWDACSP